MRISVRRRGVLCLIFVALMLAFLTLSASAQTTTSGTSVYLPMIIGTGIGDQVVALVNQQRRLNGCNVDLTISAQLSAAALNHSRDMALNDFFGHDSSDQSTMVSRVVAAGYNYSMLAENIQAGAPSPQEVVNDPIMGWMQSPGHRANILNCNLHEIGIGYYYQADDQVIPAVGGPFRHYWTADFATPLP
jgi:uncharacterized protein YkwD